MQFRMHESRDSVTLLDVASLPVIEHSTGLAFGEYPDCLRDGKAVGRLAIVQGILDVSRHTKADTRRYRISIG